MLVYKDIVDKILKKIKNKSNQLQCAQIVAYEISKFIINNLEVYGTYTGITPIGVTDPLSGVDIFPVVDCYIDPQKLLKKANQNFTSWYSQILNEIQKSTTVKTSMKGITLGKNVNVFRYIQPSQFIVTKDFEKSWQLITKFIIIDIVKSIKNQTPLNAVTVSGSGVVIINITK